MSDFGFAVYRNNGTVKLREDGGMACFIGQSTQSSTPLSGINKDWVWFVPSAFVSSSTPIYEWNMPSNLCWLTNTTIEYQKGPGEDATIFWGVA